MAGGGLAMGAGRGQAGTNMNISSLIYEKAETLAEPEQGRHIPAFGQRRLLFREM